MPQYNLTIDTGAVPLAEVADAFAAAYGYQANLPDPQNPGETIPNPVTKSQFARQRIRQYIKDIVVAYRRNGAVDTAVAGVVPVEFVDD